MPFTFAHPAAALPFRKTGLVFSAVVIGSMAPDFEYFLRWAPQDRFAHTMRGLFVFTLPVALAVLWLFHRSAKFAMVKLLPASVQQRLVCTSDFPFGNARRFALLVLSVLAGALTHIFWDSFTHYESWLAERWPLLRKGVVIPWLPHHPMLVCNLLQYVSTLIGMGILVIWFVAWLYRTEPSQTIDAPLSGATKWKVVLLLSALALCGALLRTVLVRHLSHIAHLGVFIVTAIALLWWELVALGWWWHPRHSARNKLSQL